MIDTDERIIKIADLLDKEQLDETDVLIIEDEQNTKKVSIRNLIMSIIKDNDVPTNYRIYSSEKTQKLFDSVKDTVVGDIGKIQGDIKELEDDKATNTSLENLKTELEKKIGMKVTTEELVQALSDVRRTSTKITSDDLDTSSNSVKIKLANLADEVVDAMTGNTTVIPTNRAPVGGWVTEDFADESITYKKLANDYRFGGIITEGNINEIVKDGIYLLGSNVLNLPKMENEEGDNSRILDVKRIGDKLIMQSVYYCDDSEDRPIFRRKGSLIRLHALDFMEVHEINTTFKASRDLLSEDFANCGLIDSGSIYAIRKDGDYYATKNVTDLPTENEDYMVKVSKYNDRYIFNAQAITTTTCKIYTSLLYFTAGQMPVNTSWFEVSSTSKSKFDGKKVYLFGDGILFGLGSDDITNKSISAILSNKYGMRINNRALGEASIGNYDDEILSQSSVIEQIETTPLDEADYAIIFAGGYDWKIGKATIGTSNTAVNDITFKGSINTCIKNILLKNAKTKILFCTPIFRSRIEAGDGKNSDENTVNDRYLYEYVQAMIDVCNANHVPVLNLFNISMINRYNSSIYLKDGLYPNDTGHALLADKIFDGMNMYY